MDFINFRCVRCGKLLGKVKGEAEIKCSRCSMLNLLTLQQSSENAATKTVYKEEKLTDRLVPVR